MCNGIDHCVFRDINDNNNGDINGHIHFIFHFGASKSYLSQIEAITKRAAKLKAKAQSKGHGKSAHHGMKQNVTFKLPWKSLFDPEPEQRAPPTPQLESAGDPPLPPQIEMERVRSISTSKGLDEGNAVTLSGQSGYEV